MYSQKSKGALRDTSIFFMGEKKNDVSKMMQEKVGGGGSDPSLILRASWSWLILKPPSPVPTPLLIHVHMFHKKTFIVWQKGVVYMSYLLKTTCMYGFRQFNVYNLILWLTAKPLESFFLNYIMCYTFYSTEIKCLDNCCIKCGITAMSTYSTIKRFE